MTKEAAGAGWRARVKITSKKVRVRAKANRVPILASGVAYHAFLGLFPAVIALIGVTQLIGISSSAVTSLVSGIGKALPAGASTVLTDALQAAHHRTQGALVATVIAIVVALWTSSSAMSILQSGLDGAYEVPDRKFVAKRLMALLLLLLIALLGGVAAVLTVFARPFGGFLQHHVGLSASVFDPVWTVARLLATLAALLTLMASVYRFAPNREHRGRWFTIGGALATAAWLLASVALSFYVSSFGSYAKTYGALAGVAVLMLWMYITAYSVLLGGLLNAAVERQDDAVEATGAASPPGLVV
jgi:membrane protein